MQNYAPLGFEGQYPGIQRENNQGQKRYLSFEEKMLNFMVENKSILNLHEQNFLNLQFFKQTQMCFRLIQMPP